MLKSEWIYRFNFALLKTSKIKGDDQMDELELIKGQKYKVIATNGLNLRKEPDLKSQVLILMKYESIVSLESEEAVSKDGYDWYYVRYKDKTGWAASEFLEKIQFIAEAPPPAGYSFKWGNTTYNITQPNLQSALDNKYILTEFNASNLNEIDFDPDFNSPPGIKSPQKTYSNLQKGYTSSTNITTMKNNDWLT